MPVIIVGTEKNFAALRRRLFSGSVSSKVAGRVSAAIEAANPGVDLAKLAPGTVLAVPDGLPHVSVGESVSFDPGSQQAIAAVLDAASASVAGLAVASQAQQGADAAERKRVVAALASNAVRKQRRKDQLLGPAIAAAQKELAAAEAEDKQRQAALTQAQAQWQDELAALRALAQFG